VFFRESSHELALFIDIAYNGVDPVEHT